MTRIIPVFAVVLMLSLFSSCGGDSSEAGQPDQQIKPASQTTTQVNPKSDIIRFSVLDINGKQRSSEEWIGQQPVVINVWGTWCPPCRREIPDLVRLYEEYNSKGVEMLGLAVRDSPQQVEGFAARNNMKWVMLIAGRDLLYTLGATKGVPTTIFYDRNGKEVNRFVGGRDYGTFKQAFESIL
jgi:thiol-disulfide isomerase/thioredoxin